MVSVTHVGLPRQTVTPQRGVGGWGLVIPDTTLNPMQINMHNRFIEGIFFSFSLQIQ